MMSLHRSMHSSQMYTPGPAISFLTCFWVLPQKLHLTRSPPSPNFATEIPASVYSRRNVLEGLCSADGFERGNRPGGDDLVDHAVGHRLVCRHDEVAIRVLGDLLMGLAGVLGQHA